MRRHRNSRFKRRWSQFWARRAGPYGLQRWAARLACLFVPPYYGQVFLSRFAAKGFVTPKASIYHSRLSLGERCFVGDDVVIFQDRDGGAITLGPEVHIHRGTILQTGRDGEITIGAETHIQPRCQLSAYVGAIRIGNRVEIAPNCAFYPYNHGTSPDLPVRSQPLVSRGNITIDDDAWLGYGVVVLDGVRIGKGAIIGAGSVVTRDVVDGAIAAGNPAKVLKMRSDTAP